MDAGRDAGAICARLADCDDGLYCNGAETCAPGDEGAGPDGCVAGTLPCEGDEICNEEEDACERDDCSDGGDADGDGDARPSCGGNDCDDEDGTIHSRGARAGGVDEDCDSATVQDDSGVAPDGDVDMDGFIDTAGFNVRPDGSENRGTDCDDSVTEVHPGAREECNGDDDDCDGLVDEGLGRTFWRDEDGDGHGDATMTVEDCVAPMGYADDPDDCDDTTADRSPTNNEATFPCDELDNDCDGDVDEDAGSGLTEWYPDMDEDGYGYADATPVLACSAMWAPADYVDRGGDCQDHDGEVHPGADYHDTPYCEPLLFLDSDTFECAAPGGGACGPASWDYDCSGSVEISTGSPVLGTGIGRCEYDSIGLSCVVTRGFRSMPSADDCGRDTSYVFSCNSSCLARTGSIVPSCR